MGNKPCGCEKSGGRKTKKGGNGCSSKMRTYSRRHKKGGSGCKSKKHRNSHHHKKGGVKKQSGGCGCAANASSSTLYGGYKYDRKSSIDAVKRLKHRVTKNTKTRSNKRRRKRKTRKATGRKR